MWSSVVSPLLCSKPRAGHSIIKLGCSIQTDAEKQKQDENAHLICCPLLVFGGSDCSGAFYNDTVRCTVEIPTDKWWTYFGMHTVIESVFFNISTQWRSCNLRWLRARKMTASPSLFNLFLSFHVMFFILMFLLLYFSFIRCFIYPFLPNMFKMLHAVLRVERLLRFA